MSGFSGPDVDIVTGLPVEMVKGTKGEEEAAAAKVRLKDKAGFLDCIGSDEGRKLVEIVHRKFVSRAATIIEGDPECKAYLGILKDFGIKKSLAKSAANQLSAMAMQEDKGK
ncbi:hypothetical protein [Desulfatibacillum aliphaticivorans]|uniref:hypothetical protein n=1 Tax=Desulfatibacillum aliphaticivorans TaxID=218208 RepID=UPI00048972DF|nr:hypothetical protein [Desulfatibacillum aliphaticivorans]